MFFFFATKLACQLIFAASFFVIESVERERERVNKMRNFFSLVNQSKVVAICNHYQLELKCIYLQVVMLPMFHMI